MGTNEEWKSTLLPGSQEPYLQIMSPPFFFFSSLCSYVSEVNITERLQESTTPFYYFLLSHRDKHVWSPKICVLILVVRVTNILAAPLEKSSNTNLVKTGQNQQVIFCHNTVPLLRAKTQFSPLHAYRPQISLQTISHSKYSKQNTQD